MHLFVTLEPDGGQRSVVRFMSRPRVSLVSKRLSESQSLLRRLAEKKIFWPCRDLNQYHPARHIIIKVTELSRLYLLQQVFAKTKQNLCRYVCCRRGFVFCSELLVVTSGSRAPNVCLYRCDALWESGRFKRYLKLDRYIRK